MTKPKSKPWYIWASRNPEDSYGSTIIQDRALEGADSKELAELAANQVKGTLYAGDAALLAIGVPALWNMGKTIGALPTLGRVVGGIATGVPKGTVGYMAGKYIDQQHPFGENSGVASEVLSRLLGFTSWGVGAKAGEKVATKIGKSIGDKIDKVNRGVEKYFVRRYFSRLDPNSLRMIQTPNTNTGDDVISLLGDDIPTPNTDASIGERTNFDFEDVITQSDIVWEDDAIRRTTPSAKVQDWSNVSYKDLGDILDMPNDELEFNFARTELQRRLNDPNTPGDQLYFMTRRHFDTPELTRVFNRPTLNFTNSEFSWMHGRGFVFRPSATPHQVRDAINNTINSAPRGSVFINGYSANSLPLVLHASINNYGTGRGQIRIIPTGGTSNTNGLGRGVTFRDLFSETYLTDPTTPMAVKDWYSRWVNDRSTSMPPDVRSILSRRANDMYQRYLSRAIKTNQERWDKIRILDPNLPEFTFSADTRLGILDNIIEHGNAPLFFTYPEFVVQKYHNGGKQLKNN